MKKFISIIIVLTVLALLIQYFVIILIKSHDCTYSIDTKENQYMIHEVYKKVKKEHYYTFEITDNKKTKYDISYNHDYNKQENIITDIKQYKKGNLKCIYPIFKNGNTANIYCNYENKQVSTSYLKQINNPYVEELTKKYKVQEKNSTVPTQIDNISFYKDNIRDNTIFTMWNYKGFIIAKDKEVIKKELLTKDRYENNISYLINHYYVFMNTDEENNLNYHSVYIYDIKNGGKALYSFDKPLSTNFYYNGHYDNKLYYTDVENKTQYVLNPVSETVKEIGSVKEGFYNVINKELAKVEAKDFLNSNKYFSEVVPDQKLTELYDVVNVKLDGDHTYFQTKDGSIYKAYNGDYSNAILLCRFDNISEWVVKNDGVMIVTEKYVYYYDDIYGLSLIAENNELIYNYKNICDFAHI